MGISREGKPGFPFALAFTSPAPTWLFVSVPLFMRAGATMALWCVPVYAGHLYWEIPDLGLWGTLLILPVGLLAVRPAQDELAIVLRLGQQHTPHRLERLDRLGRPERPLIPA